MDTLISKIKDDEIKDLFVKMISKMALDNLSRHAYDVYMSIIFFPYCELEKDKYIKMVFFSDPLAMVLKIKDEDFLRVVETNWRYLINRINEDNYEIFLRMLVEKYPNRFSL
jgi:hypothetical protein